MMRRYIVLIILMMGAVCLPSSSEGSGLKFDVREKQPMTTKGDLATYSTAITRLAVGTTGQVLSADSAQASGLVWANPPATGASSPLTTKGDVWTYSTVDARLAVGTTGKVLSADSAQTTGLVWADPPATGASSPLTTLGDFWVYSTADIRLAVGTDGDFISADSNATEGVSWQSFSDNVQLITQRKCATIIEPDQVTTVSTDVVLIDVDSNAYPNGIEIGEVAVSVSENMTGTYVFVSRTAPNTANTKLSEIAISSGTLEYREAPDTASTVSAGDYVIVSVDTGDVNWAQACVDFYEPSS